MSKFKNKYTTETAKEYAQSKNCILIGEYLGMNEKHEFICICGNHFTTTFAKFQNRNKTQCNICGRNKRYNQDKLKYIDVKNRIEKYGCKLLSKEYTSYKDKNLEILCHCGEIYVTSLSCYENSKHQCHSCSKNDSNNFKKLYTVEDIKDLCILNNSLLISYDINSEYIRTKDKIILQCKKCGKHFTTSLGYILSTKKFICNDCAYSLAPSSIGEILVKNILSNIKDISFKEQYSFNDCIDKIPLRFDFAVFKNNYLYLIEYDGIQHFAPFDYYGGEKNIKI
jgi:hypothetical protein